MDTTTLMKVIEMINDKILWLDSEDDKPEGFSFAGPEEPYFGKQYLAELKDRLLREIIEAKLEEDAENAEQQHELDMLREMEEEWDRMRDAENEQELNNLENQTEQ